MARRLSDEQLGRRLADGEAPAFDELYRRYAHRLAAYGTHLLGDGSAGDDVAQVALMRAYQALREGRVPESFGAWVYRVAHNVAIDSIRGRRELPQELQLDGTEELRGSEAGALTLAIAALPERQRKVFVLRELHGLRISEAAGELGLSNAQVEQALFAARNRLAEQLVFGERLSCPAVQRLASGPLDTRERRALKTHVRSCPACRRNLGLRGLALSLPLPPLRWLRMPAAVKVGAAAATAVLAAGVPLVAGHHDHGTLFASRAYGAPGPDTPLHFAPNRPAVSTAPVHTARRPARPVAAPRVVITPTAPAPIVVPVSAPVTRKPAKHAASPPATALQPVSQPLPSPARGPVPEPPGPTATTTTPASDGGGETTTTATTIAIGTTTSTTTSSDGGSDGGGDQSGSDGSGGGTSDG